MHIGPYTLFVVIHAKIDAMTLEDINLSYIEFKKHDPLNILEEHCLQISVKKYVHEESPYDNIFRRAKSYQEVLHRIQSLPKQTHDGFLNFLRARRTCLPPILKQEYRKQLPNTQTKTQSIVSQIETSVEKVSQICNPPNQRKKFQSSQEIAEESLEILLEEILKENIIH